MTERIAYNEYAKLKYNTVITDSACNLRSKKLENLTEKSRLLQQSCPWVGMTCGLGWVGSRFFSF